MKKQIAKTGIIMILSVLSAIAGIVSYEFAKEGSKAKDQHK